MSRQIYPAHHTINGCDVILSRALFGGAWLWRAMRPDGVYRGGRAETKDAALVAAREWVERERKDGE